MGTSVLLAMSGGLDSSISAYILKQQTTNVTGITFNTLTTQNNEIERHDIVSFIKNFCKIQHVYVEISELFKDNVIYPFIKSYMDGITPNPCVLCNNAIKFNLLYQKSAELQYDHIATGHYARISHNGDRYFVRRGVDIQKDQSYFLWQLNQDVLSKTIFPLGDTTKKDNKALAIKIGWSHIAAQKESMDVCFIPNNDYRKLLKQYKPTELKSLDGGDFIFHGRVIGHHHGYPLYTIGQRTGLGIAMGFPVFVTHIDPHNNTVTLGVAQDLLSNQMIVNNINMQKYEHIDDYSCTVKIRHGDIGHPATVKHIDNDTMFIKFDEPVRAVTPGQSAVFYEGDDIIGGGIISAENTT